MRRLRPFCLALSLALLCVASAAHAVSITITQPPQFRVFQRNGSGQATIPIAFTCLGGLSAPIEASFNGGAYVTIVNSPTCNGGTINSGTLLGQVQGFGALTLRYVAPNDAISDTRANIGIGDIFVVAGQSNAAGRATQLQAYTPTNGIKASLFGNDDQWHELYDPVDDSTAQVDCVSADGHSSVCPSIPAGLNGCGSCWPNMATPFIAALGVPVAFVPTARGGSYLSQWNRDPADIPCTQGHKAAACPTQNEWGFPTVATWYCSGGGGNCCTLYGSMIRRVNAVSGVRAVLWWQGESEAYAGMSEAAYESALTTFVSNVWSDLAVPVVIASIGDLTGTTGAQLDNIRFAQQAVWNAGGHGLSGPSLYDAFLNTDGIHFMSPAINTLAATRWWAATQQHFYGGDGRGPIFESASTTPARTSVVVTFADDSLPLLPVSGYSPGAWSVSGVSVTSVTRTAPNAVTLALSGAATIPVTVSYALGHTGNGAVVVSDSSTYGLVADIFQNQPAPTQTNTPTGTWSTATPTPSKTRSTSPTPTVTRTPTIGAVTATPSACPTCTSTGGSCPGGTACCP